MSSYFSSYHLLHISPVRLGQRIYVQPVQKWKGQNKTKKAVIPYNPRDLTTGSFWLHSTKTISNFSGKSHFRTFPKGSLTYSFLVRTSGGKKKKTYFFLSKDLCDYLAFLVLSLTETQIFMLNFCSQAYKVRKYHKYCSQYYHHTKLKHLNV